MFVRPGNLKPCDIAFVNETGEDLVVIPEDLGDVIKYHIYKKKTLELNEQTRTN